MQQRSLRLGAADALAGNVEILALALDAGERLSKLRAGYAGCSAAFEFNPGGSATGDRTVKPNVEANRHFAAGRVWLKMK